MVHSGSSIKNPPMHADECIWGAGCAVARCRNWFHDHQHDMKTSRASISCLLQTGAIQLGQSARVGLLFC
ncbi:hypothetical protein CK203_085377 [Vitis vinifera]|uniref:Uncharacterized protein n=1 Tax=Vitis vinifera TaxID=29760 RepID=A0A438E4F1_VITVI|nr:hypothetical protein CK203_085377 [Vitis vinifera]